MRTAALVLAAGAGRRMGRPKGLVTDARGVPWVRLAVRSMTDAGCGPVVVVTGASGEEVAKLLPAGAVRVHAADWVEGMSASLRAGLSFLTTLAEPPDAAIVGLVDTPDVTGAVVARLLETSYPATENSAHRCPDPSIVLIQETLARVIYDGKPGHPVLIGRNHWAGIIATAAGDVGARHYLRGRTDVRLVEAGDLATGADIDTVT
ncbi:hypothetical protein Kisp01_13040 [Kineosporia sp. NBRC 101677]|uniref:nucleotidyltransferase family protein n=1 Tax=Kineosporia sp. NBRC 101677 TaxID=3032197 RepID=UPI0024A0EADB|nr:nucleotidyltransferase family protein [Kineosporia sp. NBRC 101677]GLY14288.1 hypothetical protein Kisp01_13040 [Kineosporia sp. NBRC 101677]